MQLTAPGPHGFPRKDPDESEACAEEIFGAEVSIRAFPFD